MGEEIWRPGPKSFFQFFGEFGDTALGTGGDPDEDVSEVDEGVDILKPAGSDKGLQGSPLSAPSNLAAKNQLLLIAHVTQGAFGVVVVDQKPSVLDKPVERGPLVLHVPEGSTHWRLREDLQRELFAEFIQALQERDGSLLPRVVSLLGRLLRASFSTWYISWIRRSTASARGPLESRA